MADILGADLMGNRFEYMHEPIGDFGVWNGQFELGTIDDNTVEQPEGWEVAAFAGGSMTLDPTGLCGAYCYKGGQAGNGTGGTLHSLRFIPVSEDREYMLSAAIKPSTIQTTVSLGVSCYNAAQAFIATALPLNAALIGAAGVWVRRQVRIGPMGDVAFPAGTRYVRVYIALSDTALVNNWAYVDDVQFQQMKMAYSPGIRLISEVCYDGTDRTTMKDTYTAHAGSPMTLTFEEPGYLWYAYSWSWFTDTTRTLAGYCRVYVDAGGANLFAALGAAANEYHSGNIGLLRWPAILARGAHTVDLRFRAQNAGDVITIADMEGSCFYTRAY